MTTPDANRCGISSAYQLDNTYTRISDQLIKKERKNNRCSLSRAATAAAKKRERESTGNHYYSLAALSFRLFFSIRKWLTFEIVSVRSIDHDRQSVL